MWVVARRFAAVSGLGLWVGGFTLYTAFVIPVGHRHVAGGRFGYVTGEVMSVLNHLAVAALVLLLVNLAAEWRASGRLLRGLTAGTWLAMLACLVALYVLHAKLDAHLDYATHDLTFDRGSFEPLHERYELFATIQWGMSLIHLGCMLAGWRRTDAATPGRTG